MKKIFLYVLLLNGLFAYSQEKYFTKNGTITFEASVPSFEEVKATNNKVTAILKTDTGELAALALVKGFRFKIALMEEHFNENYADSDTYPKAKFTGKIVAYDHQIFLQKKERKIEIEGNLTFHGVTHKIKTPANLSFSNNSLKLLANFKVKPQDYRIEIPNLLRKKVAEEIDIQLNFTLEKK
ncbi:YceI family protein [Flavicella sediminum]|uniref:YceI family protein n=1 Tax=Flavicella sediminum TaxID=2585141 RepID=UPI001123BE40|nr:YceI family protein [Flavicella sediminum]